jgi:bifunctional ADP-heptose synthase (sugar kinase/adenylyltransferase)
MGVQVNRCYYNELNEIPKKTRVIIDGVQVARIDEYDSCQPYTGLPPLQNQVIVVSDYGKGAMNAEQVLKIIETRPKKIYINTKFPAPNFQCLDMEGQSSPNLPPTTWLCNFAEYKESQTFYDNQEHVYITKGQGGVEYKEFGRRKDKETSKAKKVVSVCGAGDVVLAALVVYDLPNIPVQIHSRGRLDFAMYAAGVAVSQPYTHCPTFKEIAEYTNIDTA